eukprot:CAMPEP_0179916722 /NCGR_PEP_ID=MMETSP0983-20121128/2409_1 /TAXON_ID=483367 /ORGANISM="non described non described, Strain CCMP 2436" /LENGTH=192 /DNA_ID=CAMNT_0021819325 /DNA_START=1701 /DNA_END=2276 /DNA_ORIENTATION=+
MRRVNPVNSAAREQSRRQFKSRLSPRLAEAAHAWRALQLDGALAVGAECHERPGTRALGRVVKRRAALLREQQAVAAESRSAPAHLPCELRTQRQCAQRNDGHLMRGAAPARPVHPGHPHRDISDARRVEDFEHELGGKVGRRRDEQGCVCRVRGESTLHACSGGHEFESRLCDAACASEVARHLLGTLPPL